MIHQNRTARYALAGSAIALGMSLGSVFGTTAASAASTAPTLATTTVTSTTTTSTSPMTTAELSDAKAVFHLVNNERAANGLPALKWNNTLANCSAYNHSALMAADNTMSHQLPGEAYFADRITACGYKWSTVGENIGWTTNMTAAGAKSIETSMYNEVPPNDGHRLNILSTAFTQVGVAVVLDNTNHKLWLTEDFGAPA